MARHHSVGQSEFGKPDLALNSHLCFLCYLLFKGTVTAQEGSTFRLAGHTEEGKLLLDHATGRTKLGG